MDEETGLKIIDEKTGILLISIENPFNLLDFVIDNDFNIILFCSKSFKYLSFNFELLKKIEWGQSGYFFLDNDKRCFVYELTYRRLSFLNKYNENTNEVA